MEQHELLTTLQTLQTQLSSAGELDPETERLLHSVTSNIQNQLAHRAGTQPAGDADASISERVREALIEFEVRHPHVSGLLERITDGLASIGI